MTSAEQATLGIVGGSGFYEIDGLENTRRLEIETPYGPPSDALVLGDLKGLPVAFVSRHGAGHRLSPSEVPYRANVWALASLGVRSLVSISAVGSLQAQIAPLHIVVPDQLIDRSTGIRPATFFGGGIVAHVSLDQPYCQRLNAALAAAAAFAGVTVHRGGSLLVVEGPAFSTKAESFLYQGWGASIIGMTAMPEARLAREAGMCYACLACVTDYDTWHEHHGAVTVEIVLQNLFRNVDKARTAISHLASNLPDWQACDCCASLSSAIITKLELVPEQRKRELAPILSRYVI